MNNIINLRDYKNYLSSYLSRDRPILFEKLVSESVSEILKLPHYTGSSVYHAEPYYIQWFGMTDPLQKAPQGGSDAVGHCHGYKLLIEASLETNAIQNSREYAPSIRHLTDFVRQYSGYEKDTYVLFVTPKLHEDTYHSIKTHLKNPLYSSTIIPIETNILAELLDISFFIFTTMHVDVRMILNDICSEMKESKNIDNFNRRIKSKVKTWRKQIIESGKGACLSLLVYELMIKRGAMRNPCQISDIYATVKDTRVIKKYSRILDCTVTDDLIQEALLEYGFARLLSKTFQNVALLEFAPYPDIKKRFENYNSRLETLLC